MLTKLNSIEAQANKYVLPQATTITIGGVKMTSKIDPLASDSDLADVIIKINSLLSNLRSSGVISL